MSVPYTNIFRLIMALFCCQLSARNIILEFKGAYFLPTNSLFKDIYRSDRALYGPELTVQLCNTRPWYGFASVDYLRSHGQSLCQPLPTKVTLLPVAFGVKYFAPTCHDCFDLYVGLGFQALRARTNDCLVTNTIKTTQWGFGGIAKLGTYFYLPHCFVLDLFIDYSFVSVGKKKVCTTNAALQYKRTHITGPLFGAGIGYRF